MRVLGAPRDGGFVPWVTELACHRALAAVPREPFAAAVPLMEEVIHLSHGRSAGAHEPFPM